MRYPIFMLLLIFTLAGCNTQQSVPVSQVTSTQFANSATVSGTSDFDANLRVQGAWVGGGTNRYLLRGSIGKTSKNITMLQLYIQLYYSSKNWIFYETAQDGSAQSIDLTVINREVGSCSGSLGYCSYYEDVGVGLTLEYLLGKQNTGFKVRILGKGGNSPRIYEVPANYLQGFLLALKNQGAIELENFAEASDTDSAVSQEQPAQAVLPVQSEASNADSAVSQEQPAQAVSPVQSKASDTGSAVSVAISDGNTTKLQCNRTKGKVIDFELDLSSVSGKIAAKNIFQKAHRGGCPKAFSCPFNGAGEMGLYKYQFDGERTIDFQLKTPVIGVKSQPDFKMIILPDGRLVSHNNENKWQCDKNREDIVSIWGS